MLICIFVTFVFQAVKSYIQGGSNMTGTDLCVRLYKSVPVIFEPHCNFFLSKTKQKKHGHAPTNQNLKAHVYCKIAEHRFVNIFFSRRKRNPSDIADSVRYFLTENIARSNMLFAYISRKLNCLQL